MSVSVPDSTMSSIDAEVKRLGVNRSHFVAEAIDFYIGNGRNLENEIKRINNDLKSKTEEAKSLSGQVLRLEENHLTIENQSRIKEDDINRLNNELAEKTRENKSLAEEVLQLEDSLPTIKKQLAEAQKESNSKL